MEHGLISIPLKNFQARQTERCWIESTSHIFSVPAYCSRQIGRNRVEKDGRLIWYKRRERETIRVRIRVTFAVERRILRQS